MKNPGFYMKYQCLVMSPKTKIMLVLLKFHKMRVKMRERINLEMIYKVKPCRHRFHLLLLPIFSKLPPQTKILSSANNSAISTILNNHISCNIRSLSIRQQPISKEVNNICLIIQILKRAPCKFNLELQIICNSMSLLKLNKDKTTMTRIRNTASKSTTLKVICLMQVDGFYVM